MSPVRTTPLLLSGLLPPTTSALSYAELTPFVLNMGVGLGCRTGFGFEVLLETTAIKLEMRQLPVYDVEITKHWQKIAAKFGATAAHSDLGESRDPSDLDESPSDSLTRRASATTIELVIKEQQDLGEGTFGSVDLVKVSLKDGNKNDSVLMARKTMKLVGSDGKECRAVIDRERARLEECDSLMVNKLYGVYEDTVSIHFLLEYCYGGDLYSVFFSRNSKVHSASNFRIREWLGIA